MAISTVTHSGVVLNTFGDTVTVAVESSEACGSCASRSACSLGTQTNTRNILITTPDASLYRVGEKVIVSTRTQMGLLAVALCYALPAVVLVAAIIIAHKVGFSDGASALMGLFSVAISYGILWLRRKKLAQKISFTIQKE